MNPQDLYNYALICKEQNEKMQHTVGMSLVGKMPKTFPRGELLCEGPNGPVRSYDPEKVINWLVKNNLVKLGEDQNI